MRIRIMADGDIGVVVGDGAVGKVSDVASGKSGMGDPLLGGSGQKGLQLLYED